MNARRRFVFSAGIPARVTCCHCDWTSVGRRTTPAQEVFDRSNAHECDGVESYPAMLARTAADREVAR